MLDDAPEPVGPLPFDPVHHIASIGCAQRAGIVAVEPCITFARRREPLLQVLKRPPAPIAATAVGEGLTIAGRAMEIDRDHGIARPCAHRRVPATGPAVVAIALRPAMHHQRPTPLAPTPRGPSPHD